MNNLGLSSIRYDEDYKEQAFLLWYKAAKPGAHRLRDLLMANGEAPSVTTLSAWIRDEFSQRAELLDAEVRYQLEQRLVKEKVEMLTRHADLGRKLQEKAWSFLENTDKLSSAQAIRALVEGIRIERESSGLPEALSQALNKSDDELLDAIQKIVEKVPVSIEPIDDIE